MQLGDGGGVPDAWSASFAEAVRHAYFVEHGIQEDKGIAEMLGVTKGALSQQLGKPAPAMKGESLARLLRPIRLPELRTEVVVAWSRELMDDGAVPGPDEPWGTAARRLVLRNRPDLALRVALKALESADLPEERWAAFLQSVSCCFRLDLPGEATRLCGLVREWGERDGIPELVAVAHAAGSRAMRRTTLFTAGQVADERDRAAAILRRGPAPEGRLAAAAAFFAKELVASEQVNDALRVHDFKGGNDAELARMLRIVHGDRERSAKTTAGRARNAQQAARILLALGKPDEAEPYIREAMEEGAREPSVRLEGEHLLGRLLAERGKIEEALSQLKSAARLCVRYRFVYLGRVVETEIARLELAHPGRSSLAG